MRTSNSIKNSLTSLLSNVIVIITLFVEKSFFIKILGIDYSGIDGLFNNILTILNLIELGIGSSITYNLYSYVKKDDKETIKSIMNFFRNAYNVIILIIFFVGLFITFFVKYTIKEVTVDINIYIVYFLFLISTISTYLLSYKRNLIYANQKKYIMNIVHIIYILVLSFLQILILYITKNYYLYIIVKIICILLENIIISIKANKMYPYLKEKNIKPLKSNIKKSIMDRVKALFLHKTAGSIANGTDNILISSFIGIKTLGLYTNYYYIITALKKIFLDIINSTGASVGNLLLENNYEKNFETFKKIRFINYWIAVFTSICIFQLSSIFITIWLGKEYILDSFVVLVLAVNYFQNLMRASYNTFKEAGGIWIEDRHVPILQCSTNVIASIILLKIFGLAGVFMGTIVSSLFVWIYSYPKYVYKKLFNRKSINYFSEFFIHIFIYTFLIIAFILINNKVDNIFIKILSSILIPNIVLFIIYKNTNEFKYFKDIILRRIKHEK